jgi:hypothetical protein
MRDGFALLLSRACIGNNRNAAGHPKPDILPVRDKRPRGTFWHSCHFHQDLMNVRRSLVDQCHLLVTGKGCISMIPAFCNARSPRVIRCGVSALPHLPYRPGRGGGGKRQVNAAEVEAPRNRPLYFHARASQLPGSQCRHVSFCSDPWRLRAF